MYMYLIQYIHVHVHAWYISFSVDNNFYNSCDYCEVKPQLIYEQTSQ